MKEKGSIIFWNIAGAKKLKKETWSDLKKCQTIGLVETWETGNERWEEEFEKFEWRSIEGVKEHRKGRAKGGIFLAIKEGVDRKVIEWKREESNEVLGVRVNGKKING